MNETDIESIFKVMIFTYLLAASFSLILYKKHKLANIVSNILCMIASILGTWISVFYITHGNGWLVITNYKLSVPLISINITLDKLSAFFVLGLSILVFCTSLYSISYLSHYYYKRNVGIFNFLYVGFILSMLLVLTAGNTMFFLIAWEVMSLISYFLVTFESENVSNQKAGTLYIIMTHFGTAFLFIAFMLIFGCTGSFSVFSSSELIPQNIKNIIFILFLIGFGTKAGIIPLHIWLPYAHPAASSNISALMSGIMIKTAIYGLIRFVLCYLGVQYTWWGMSVLIIGMLSAVLGVAYALMEHDIKRLLAYSSIENIGIILIGLGVSMIACAKGNVILGSLALIASLFHTFNHAIFKGGLFLGSGAIQFGTHTKNIESLGGLIRRMPVTAFFMLCFSLAICAIVPFNGFVSEWLTYQALFFNINYGQAEVNIITVLSAAALAISGAMALACFVKLFGISFLGLPRTKDSQDAKEVPNSMKLGMGILALLCMILGLFPKILINIIDKVSSEVFKTSIINDFNGSISIINFCYPINISGNSISIVSVLILLLIIGFGVLLLTWVINRNLNTRRYTTWDCGFTSLTNRMQYTATGFSKPIRIVFKMLYKPSRELKVIKGDSKYYPESLIYNVYTKKIIEKYFYYPLFKFLRRLSQKFKFIIQAGSIHIYLMYIFIVMLAILLYNSSV